MTVRVPKINIGLKEIVFFGGEMNLPIFSSCMLDMGRDDVARTQTELRDAGSERPRRPIIATATDTSNIRHNITKQILHYYLNRL